MVDASQALVVAVVTRAPSSGGKSRLFSALGLAPDPALLSAMLLDTLDGVAAPGTERVVAVDPPEACGEILACVPPEVAVVPQTRGSLGERMRGLMASLFTRGARGVALVGSDVPDITARTIAAAFAALADDPEALVLGPATDGGYYLVAATSVPDVFDRIEWGSPRVLEQTQAGARRAGLRVRLLDAMSDVDSPDDLWAVTAPRTAAWTKEKWRSGEVEKWRSK